MKVYPWLFPAAALLVTGGWIFSTHQSAATVRQEIAQLTERIQLAQRYDQDQARGKEAEAKAKRDADKKIDWKSIAAKMGQSRMGGMPRDMREMMRMQRVILDMSAEEIVAQMDQIAALGLDKQVSDQLIGMLIGALADKDPKLVLDRFSDRIGEERGSLSWQLGDAFRKWTSKDATAATAWLDAQISAGKFDSKSLDGKSQSRLAFESGLIGSLLAADPTAASARVMALPAEQRKELLNQGFYMQLKPENEGNFAKLARESLSKEEAAEVMANMAGNYIFQSDGYDKVDHFISSTQASEAEQKAIVEKAFQNTIYRKQGKTDEATIEKARDWAQKYAPDSVDQMTGQSLGQVASVGNSFETNSNLALKYQEKTGNDDVLVAFLKSDNIRYGKSNDAAALVPKIKDAAKRAELEALYSNNK
jgi:hypothetical protein